MAAHAGEMRVNIGGDPGRDDYGLPPVDIEIPDDARELDRDVQAYHRELRAQRWRRRTRRLQGPLTRDGMVLPLLAGCLALTLLAGTLLTVFSGGPLSSVTQTRASNRLPAALVSRRRPADTAARSCAAWCWPWSRPAAGAWCTCANWRPRRTTRGC